MAIVKVRLPLPPRAHGAARAERTRGGRADSMLQHNLVLLLQ
jgi:hypothetical protein